MPLMQLKMLVLPAPLGPMMAKKSVALTSRLTPARAITPPKCRCISSRVSNAIPAPSPLCECFSLQRFWYGGASLYQNKRFISPLYQRAWFYDSARSAHLGNLCAVLLPDQHAGALCHAPYRPVSTILVVLPRYFHTQRRALAHELLLANSKMLKTASSQ